MLDLVITSRLPERKNCLGCAKYLACKDARKSVLFACDRFSETLSSKKDAAVRLFDFGGMDFNRPTTDDMDKMAGLGRVLDPYAKEKAFDINKVIDDIILNDEVVSSDIKIADRDFPQAPNFYTFCVSDKFLNQKPFLEQALIGTIVLSEYCPRCSDMEWINHTHKVDDSLHKFERRVALLNKGVCPHCRKTKSYFVRKGELNFYNEAALSVGQRGGKSAWLGMMAAYLTHWQLKLQKPNEVYGLLRANILHGTFAALTYAQAKDTLWEPYYGHLTDSPFFTAYHEMLDDASEKYGEELYKLKDTFVMYRHRRILVYPAGPDKRTLRGRTRFMASIDELGWFPNDMNNSNVKMNANEVYIALERSLLTVRAAADSLLRQGFDNVPPGYFLNISSPSSVRDKIMELVRKAQGSKKIYGTIKPTWLMNPKVPRSALEEEFKKDPVAAMRDYGAEPPLTSSPMISSQSAVENCFDEKTNPIRITHAQKKARDGTVSRYAYIDKMKKSGSPSVLAIDAGYSNNSFACVVAHLEDKKYPKIDLMVEIMPLPGVPLNYSKIYEEILSPLIDGRNVQLTAADRWNSLKILSDIEEEFEIHTTQYSLKYPDMQVFKDYILEGQILFPMTKSTIEEILAYNPTDYPNCFKNRPVDHFILQLLTVQDTGSSVIKGDQLTDDLVRAAMLANTMLLDPKYAELWEQDDKALKSSFAPETMGVYRGASGGRSGTTQKGTLLSTLGMARSCM